MEALYRTLNVLEECSDSGLADLKKKKVEKYEDSVADDEIHEDNLSLSFDGKAYKAEELYSSSLLLLLFNFDRTPLTKKNARYRLTATKNIWHYLASTASRKKMTYIHQKC